MKCAYCGREFTPRRGYEDVQRHCSPRCRQYFNSPPKESTIPALQRIAPPVVKPVKTSATEPVKKRVVKPATIELTQTCAHCGKKFHYHRIRKYCPKCALIVRRERTKQWIRENYPPPAKYCKQCGCPIPPKRHYCDACNAEHERTYQHEYYLRITKQRRIWAKK